MFWARSRQPASASPHSQTQPSILRWSLLACLCQNWLCGSIRFSPAVFANKPIWHSSVPRPSVQVLHSRSSVGLILSPVAPSCFAFTLTAEPSSPLSLHKPSASIQTVYTAYHRSLPAPSADTPFSPFLLRVATIIPCNARLSPLIPFLLWRFHSAIRPSSIITPTTLLYYRSLVRSFSLTHHS